MDIDALVAKALKQHFVPGLALGIIHQGKTQHCKGYGVADIQTKAPILTDTVFALGSCTKAMTAFVIQQLVTEGKVSWEDKVCQHLPNFTLSPPELAKQITLLDLIAHRTGVRRHDAMWALKPFSKDELLARLRYLESSHDLRQNYLYNNLMYGVAGLVIEQVTGNSWQEKVQQYLIQPLGMKQTSFNYHGLQTHPNFAKPYAYYDNAIQEVDLMDLSCVLPAGGLNASLNDLLLWAGSQLEGEHAMDTSFINDAQNIHMPFNKVLHESQHLTLAGYGLGWFIGQYRSKPLVCHGGSVNGYSADVALLPDQQLAVVSLSNNSSHGRFAIQQIREAIFDSYLDESEPKEAPQSPKVSISPTKSLVMPTYEPDLKQYIGQYQNPAYGTLSVFIKDENLCAEYGHMNTVFRVEKGNRFTTIIEQLKMYGAPPETEVNFYLNDFTDDFAELHICFERFRGYPPVVFTRTAVV